MMNLQKIFRDCVKAVWSLFKDVKLNRNAKFFLRIELVVLREYRTKHKLLLA